MRLVLCAATDLPALWAYAGLRARGMEELELVSAELLASALRWEHRVRPDAVPTTIALADGRTIQSERVASVLNRLAWIGDGPLTRATAADRLYATQELVALHLSWLHALACPVLNPATPQGLPGRFRDPAEWTLLAWQAGLGVRPHRRRARGDRVPKPDADDAATAPVTRSVLVVADRTAATWTVDDGLAAACVELARLAGTPLLGIDLADGPDGPRGTPVFAGATPLPDLSVAGAAGLDALGDALAGRVA